MVMQMGIFDKIYTSGLSEVEMMNGMERTYFMDDIYQDYKMSKDLQQTKMEAFYFDLLKQLIKDYGN